MEETGKHVWNAYWRDFVEQPIGEFGKLTLNEYKQMVSRLLDRNKLKLVIEAGSGVGVTSIPFAEAKAEVILIDISIHALKAARNLFLAFPQEIRPHFVVGDVLHLPIKNHSADLVFNQGVLEHFNANESVEILEEMKRVGRTVMVSVPYRMNVGYQIAKFLCRVLRRPWPFGETMEREYTEENLINELRKAGLRPILLRKWGRSWALKHLLVVITSKHAIVKSSSTRPIVEKAAYMTARVLSVLTLSFEQLATVCV